MIYNGLGYAYEQKNEFEKAIMYLEKITSGSAGDFKEDARTRTEFLDLISHKNLK